MASPRQGWPVLIVVDTHVLLWWASTPERLSARARRSFADADRIGVPAIVFWEVSVLSRRGRIAIDGSAQDWTATVLGLPRVQCLPMTCAVAALADSLPMHPDPADRFIVATAIELEAPLATADRDLRRLRLVRTVW